MTQFKLSQLVNMRITVVIVTLLPICITVPRHGDQERHILASTEIPIEHIDPGSIDLTPLINTLLNATHTGSEYLFSVLSVTSHSSLALHKITLLVYNISNFQDIETSVFPLRYCYCVTNKTNDLTDFTAILLDVMGNSTSYLQELFKSNSILSVSQRRSPDCIYICVMAGKSDSDLMQLWDSIPPLFNQTFIEHTHKGNISYPDWPFVTSAVPIPTQQASPPKSIDRTSPTSTTAKHDPVTTEPPTTDASTQLAHTTVSMATTSSAAPRTTATPTTTPATSKTPHKDKSGCPWRSELFYRGSQIEDMKETFHVDLSSPTISTAKLQPCVFELCKFFSQCLCRGLSHKTSLRYCITSHFWYEKHTVEVCSRMKRITFSKNLKQKCLARMCVKM